jgi:hypothetical protein
MMPDFKSPWEELEWRLIQGGMAEIFRKGTLDCVEQIYKQGIAVGREKEKHAVQPKEKKTRNTGAVIVRGKKGKYALTRKTANQLLFSFRENEKIDTNKWAACALVDLEKIQKESEAIKAVHDKLFGIERPFYKDMVSGVKKWR